LPCCILASAGKPIRPHADRFVNALSSERQALTRHRFSANLSRWAGREGLGCARGIAPFRCPRPPCVGCWMMTTISRGRRSKLSIDVIPSVLRNLGEMLDFEIQGMRSMRTDVAIARGIAEQVHSSGQGGPGEMSTILVGVRAISTNRRLARQNRERLHRGGTILDSFDVGRRATSDPSAVGRRKNNVGADAFRRHALPRNHFLGA